ncbi:MAG: imidazolonepropionase, partial [Desulfobacteraceae bacterium]
MGLIEPGALLIANGLVVRVGRERQVACLALARRADCLDAGGRVVMPGFVDSHTHALFTGPRLEDYLARIRGATYSQIGRAGGGIQASARQMRHVGEPALTRRLSSAIDLFLEHGTTTVEVKSGYGLEEDQEWKMLKAIGGAAAEHGARIDLVPTLLAHDVPARFRRYRQRFLDLWNNDLIPRAGAAGLAECFDVFCDRGYFSIAEARQLLTAAAGAGLRLKIHAEQLAHTGAARLAASLAAVSADHLDHVTKADINHLRQAGTIATLLPGSTLHLGTGAYPPARQLIDAGVPVALATNFNPGSAPTANMQLMLSLACSQMRMTPAEAVTAATINGAYAVGRGTRVGSLEPGKQADLVIMNVSDYREIPYYMGMNHCETVLKKG